jgi:alpha-glucosidase (family GH31 glycosyl hydrolase)
LSDGLQAHQNDKQEKARATCRPFQENDIRRPGECFVDQSRMSQIGIQKWPLDIFFVASADPSTVMAESARVTGHAEMPRLWSFGCQHSHRTLTSLD